MESGRTLRQKANPKALKMWTKSIKAAKINVKLRRVTNVWRGDDPDVSWRSFGQVGISGVDAVVAPKSPLMRRLLWTTVLLICFTLMLVQCCDRVLRFADEPVNVNVRVTHNLSLEFPSVTVCNKNPFNVTKALRLLVEHGVLMKNATESAVRVAQLVGVNAMTPTQVWTQLAQDRSAFVTECWFGRGVNCDKIGTWSLVHTVNGPCYLYELENEQINVTGTFNNLYLRFEDRSGVEQRPEAAGVRVVLHERHDPPLLLVRTQSIAVDFGWARDVKLELRKFRTLDTAKTPCLDERSYSEAKCHAECFKNAVREVSRCQMPYMPENENGSDSNSFGLCLSPQEYEETTNMISQMLDQGGWGVHQCDCKLECHETTFLAYPESFAFKPKSIRMRIFYNELVFEQIEEEFAYSAIALLCDVGGTMGLMMGASVLTVCELLEVAWSRFLKLDCRQKPTATALVAPQPEPTRLSVKKLLASPKQTAFDVKALEDAFFGDKIIF